MNIFIYFAFTPNFDDEPIIFILTSWLNLDCFVRMTNSQ